MASSNYYGLLPEERPGLLSGSAAFDRRMAQEPRIDLDAAAEPLPDWMQVASSWPLLIPAFRGLSATAKTISAGTGLAKQAAREASKFDPSRRKALKRIASTAAKNLLDYAPLVEVGTLLPEVLPEPELGPLNDLGFTLKEWANAQFYDNKGGDIWPADLQSRGFVSNITHGPPRIGLSNEYYEDGTVISEEDWWKYVYDIDEDDYKDIKSNSKKRYAYPKSIRKLAADYWDDPEKTRDNIISNPEDYVEIRPYTNPESGQVEGWEIVGGETLKSRGTTEYWLDDFRYSDSLDIDRIFETKERAQEIASRMLLESFSDLRRSWVRGDMIDESVTEAILPYDDDAMHIDYGEDAPRHPQGRDAGYWKTDAKLIKSHKDVGGSDRSKLLSSGEQGDPKSAVGLRSNPYPSRSWRRSGVSPEDRKVAPSWEKIWEARTLGRDKPKDWNK